MFALDVLYWTSLFLGASYVVLTLAIGGVSHAFGGIHHAGDVGGHVDMGQGGVGDGDVGIGHGDVGAGHGDMGHAGVVQGDAGAGHVDMGNADAGHAGVGHADAGHVDTGHAASGHADTTDMAHHAADHGQADSAHSQSEHGLEVVHVGHGHGHAADADEGSRFNLLAFLNPTMTSSFLIGFGGGGVVSRVSGAGAVPSIACAGVSGSLLYYYARWLIMRVFGAAQASSHTRLDDLLGRPATVIAPIEGSHAGMVALVVGGSRQTFRALSSEGEVIPVGTSVRVRRVQHDTVLVTRDDASGESSFQPPASL